MENEDIFGDSIKIKKPNTLRIGFQNIGGFPLIKNKHKDDIIRCGINKWDFDLFGMAETHIDWRLIREEDRLYLRTKEWWESSHLSFSYNCSGTPITAHQYGGTALFSLSKASHRAIAKGADPTKLGRWSWTRYRGRNNHTLRVIVGYRPNPPGGPFTVYAQHLTFFNSQDKDLCPREAFLHDLCSAIKEFKEQGDHIILLLDGNTGMRRSDLQTSLENCQMREVILEKHGTHGPSTYRRNNSDTPIDGIWATPGIEIQEGGYFDYDSVFINTDHRCLWIDISFSTAFGHNMPHITRPAARRLHCNDPCLVQNYVSRYERFIIQNNLLQLSNDLASTSQYPPTDDLIVEYEHLDTLRCRGVAFAERKCRKLCMGNVDYSPEIQAARLLISAWSLILKRAKGLKVSSRLLQRTLRKASLTPSCRARTLESIQDQLTLAYKNYYSIKGSNRSPRKTSLEKRAEAIAAQRNQKKATVLRCIREREKQRNTARKIRYLRGKVNSGSTTMVTVQDEAGNRFDLTSKEHIEQAIMKNNEEKYRQSSHTPFYQFPLVNEFGFKGLTSAAQAVLSGVYESNHPIEDCAQALLEELEMPEKVRELGPQNMKITKEDYRGFWLKAKENTSCYPAQMSFATMNAGATSDVISQLECNLTNIPLQSGFSPNRWQKFMDVMILKRSGLTDLNSLRTIVLFPVDCNYAFKHIGREMMKVAERTNSSALEQYGSCKAHRAIDLAVNKTLTNDLLQQLPMNLIIRISLLIRIHYPTSQEK